MVLIFAPLTEEVLAPAFAADIPHERQRNRIVGDPLAAAPFQLLQPHGAEVRGYWRRRAAVLLAGERGIM